MFGLNVFVEPSPVGQINSLKQDSYNVQFRKNDASLFMNEKISKSYNRQLGDIPPQYDKHKVIHHEHVTVNMNNLMNFNPAHHGNSYFHEHDTNKHLYHKSTSFYPNETKADHRDTRIIDEISYARKNSNVYTNPVSHSQKLKVRSV
jgi:hypothetical protein